MIVNTQTLNQLTVRAKVSLRLRVTLDLRNSEEDGAQRMLNAIEPGTNIPIHRYQNTSETVVCLRGKAIEEFYDELERHCVETIELTPNGPNYLINIPKGQWHTIRSLESGIVIFSAKDGKWEPLGDEDIL